MVRSGLISRSEHAGWQGSWNVVLLGWAGVSTVGEQLEHGAFGDAGDAADSADSVTFKQYRYRLRPPFLA